MFIWVSNCLHIIYRSLKHLFHTVANILMKDRCYSWTKWFSKHISQSCVFAYKCMNRTKTVQRKGWIYNNIHTNWIVKFHFYIVQGWLISVVLIPQPQQVILCRLTWLKVVSEDYLISQTTTYAMYRLVSQQKLYGFGNVSHTSALWCPKNS